MGPFNGLPALADDLRGDLDPDRESRKKKFILLFAYNGVGKTRLSGAFRDQGKQTSEDSETTSRDTLYFNAFTEDLFTWYNDLQERAGTGRLKYTLLSYQHPESS